MKIQEAVVAVVVDISSRLVPVICEKKQLVGNMSSVAACSGTGLILLSVASHRVYVIIWSVIKAVLVQGCENYREFYQPLQNSMRLKGGVKQVPYCKPTNIRRPEKKFSDHGDLSPGTCTSL